MTYPAQVHSLLHNRQSNSCSQTNTNAVRASPQPLLAESGQTPHLGVVHPMCRDSFGVVRPSKGSDGPSSRFEHARGPSG